MFLSYYAEIGISLPLKFASQETFQVKLSQLLCTTICAKILLSLEKSIN